MKTVKVDLDIYNLILNHYLELQDPTDDDRKVQCWLLQKELRRMDHDMYMQDRALDDRLSKLYIQES